MTKCAVVSCREAVAPDAELRNGNQAVVAGSFDASGGFTGVVVDASKEAK